MSWEDRIVEASYTSPSGVRTVFQYEDVSEQFDKKTKAYTFPDVNGTYMQDLGHSGRRWPFILYFTGEDYDLEADVFSEALKETGVGKLEHPFYGLFDVVPGGAISRRDRLTTAANQAIFELTFFETTGVVYPLSDTDPASEVQAAVTEYNEAEAQAFEDAATPTSEAEKVGLRNRYQSLIDTVSDRLSEIASFQDDVNKEFNTIVASINQGIDVLIAEPLQLAFQTSLMIQAPAQSLAAITARLKAYTDLTNSIISGNGAVVSANRGDEFHLNNLYVMGYVTGAVSSVVNNQFGTKPETIAAAESLLNLMDSVVDWREANFQAIEQVDTGEAYQQLQEAVALAAGFLVQISFTLKQERSLVLSRPRTILDLEAELYGTTDENLDFLIRSNNLTGSEILEVPRDREILYYV